MFEDAVPVLVFRLLENKTTAKKLFCRYLRIQLVVVWRWSWTIYSEAPPWQMAGLEGPSSSWRPEDPSRRKCRWWACSGARDGYGIHIAFKQWYNIYCRFRNVQLRTRNIYLFHFNEKRGLCRPRGLMEKASDFDQKIAGLSPAGVEYIVVFLWKMSSVRPYHPKQWLGFDLFILKVLAWCGESELWCYLAFGCWKNRYM